MNTTINPYKVLGVSPLSSYQQIIDAGKELRKGLVDNSPEFNRVQDAIDMLVYSSRAKFDRVHLPERRGALAEVIKIMSRHFLNHAHLGEEGIPEISGSEKAAFDGYMEKFGLQETEIAAIMPKVIEMIADEEKPLTLDQINSISADDVATVMQAITSSTLDEASKNIASLRKKLERTTAQVSAFSNASETLCSRLDDKTRFAEFCKQDIKPDDLLGESIYATAIINMLVQLDQGSIMHAKEMAAIAIEPVAHKLYFDPASFELRKVFFHLVKRGDYIPEYIAAMREWNEKNKDQRNIKLPHSMGGKTVYAEFAEICDTADHIISRAAAMRSDEALKRGRSGRPSADA